MSGVKGMKHGSRAQVTSFAEKMVKYLEMNFAKLSPERQLKIAENFAIKAMPTQVNSDINQTIKQLDSAEKEQIAQTVRDELRKKQLAIEN